MRRAILIASILMFLVVSPGVWAEDPDPRDTAHWCYDFNFYSEDGTLPHQEYFTLVDGVYTVPGYPRGANLTQLRLHGNFPTANVTFLHVNGYSNSSAFTGDNSARLYSATLDPGDPWPSDTQHTLLSLVNIDQANNKMTDVETQPTRSLRINMRIQSGNVWLRYIRLYGTGTSPFGESNCDGFTPPEVAYVKPLATYGPTGMIENEEGSGILGATPENSTFAFSPAPGAPVSAGIDGTVVRVRSLRDTDCWQYIGTPSLVNLLKTPWGFARSACGIDAVSGDWIFPFEIESGSQWNPNSRQGQLVTIRGENQLGETVDLNYFVNNAYVQEGDLVQAGCWIGETIELKNPMESFEDLRLAITAGFSGGAGLSVAIVESIAAQGFTLVAVNSGDEAYEHFTIDPPNEDVCNNRYPYEGCLGDSVLQHPGDWQYSTGITWRNPGVTLYPGQAISRVDALTEARLPGMTIIAGSSGSGNLSVTLGASNRVFFVNGPPREYILSHGAAAVDGSYTIRLENVGQVPISIDFVCVSYGLDESLTPVTPNPGERPPGGSNVCYFVNHSFTDGTTGWVTNAVNIGAGQLYMQPGTSQIHQSVSLPPGEYTIRARLGIASYGEFSNDVTNDAQEFGVEYAWPDAGWSEIGSETLSTYAQNGYVLDLTKVITVEGSTASGDFAFRVTNTGGMTGLTSVGMRSVCLEIGDTTTGDPPRFWPDDPTRPPSPGIFPEVCEAVEVPGGNGIGEWTVYHWSNLNNFFQCDLMVLLNGMYQVVDGIGRYIPALAQHYGEWSEDQFFPWLGGYLSNASGATIYYDEAESCSWWDIPCHLRSLADSELMGLLTSIVDRILGPIVDFVSWLGQQIFGLLFDLLRLLIELMFKAASQLAMLLLNMRDWGFSIIQMYQEAEPTPIPGLPNCPPDSVPDGNDMICWFYWTAENTVFGGDWGSLIMPLFATAISILYVLNIIQQIKAVVHEASLRL